MTAAFAHDCKAPAPEFRTCQALLRFRRHMADVFEQMINWVYENPCGARLPVVMIHLPSTMAPSGTSYLVFSL
jgi:hypothetical protein